MPTSGKHETIHVRADIGNDQTDRAKIETLGKGSLSRRSERTKGHNAKDRKIAMDKKRSRPDKYHQDAAIPTRRNETDKGTDGRRGTKRCIPTSYTDVQAMFIVEVECEIGSYYPTHRAYGAPNNTPSQQYFFNA